jgi:rubrerythrin
MELTTFGAVLKFALDLESRLTQFYAEAAGAADAQSLKGVLNELAAAGETNARKLEQVRRQQVNEMLLEPIDNANATSYEPDLTPPESDSGRLAAARSAESAAERFYHDMARLLSIPEVVRSFARIAEMHAQSRRKLSS